MMTRHAASVGGRMGEMMGGCWGIGCTCLAVEQASRVCKGLLDQLGHRARQELLGHSQARLLGWPRHSRLVSWGQEMDEWAYGAGATGGCIHEWELLMGMLEDASPCKQAGCMRGSSCCCCCCCCCCSCPKERTRPHMPRIFAVALIKGRFCHD